MTVSIAFVTVTASYLTPDGDAAVGTVTFTPSITPATEGALVPAPLAVTLVDGALSVDLLATDDAGWAAPGWTYRVTERIRGTRPRSYSIEVPGASSTLDLALVAPVVDPATVTAYLLTSQLGAALGVASLDADGQVPLSQLGNAPTGGGGSGTPASTVTAETSYGASSAAGVATAYSRGDHTHGTPALPTPAAIGASATSHDHSGTYDPAGSADDALSSALAADIQPSSTVVSGTSYGASATAGVAATASRGDHSHGTVALGTSGTTAAAGNHTHSGTYEPAGTVAAHEADTTNVHGIADTSALSLTSHTHTGTYQPLDADLTTIAGLTATTDNVVQSVGSAWASRTPAQLKATLALAKGDVGLGNVDNTADTGKPVSTAQQTALDLKADLASPALTGNPTAPTQTAGNNSTRLATTEFVTTAVAGAGGGTVDSSRSFPRTGNWYRAPSAGPVGANLTMVLNRLYMVPFRVGLAFTADRIGCDVATVGSSGAVLRLGIFNADATNYLPGTLVLDAGTVQGDTGTGSRVITISQALAAGVYWLGVVMQTASGVLLRATVSYDPLLPYFTAAAAITGTESAGCVFANSISGALASTPTLVDNDRGPLLSVRSA